jgi:acetyl-CoA C-acetyltransferase
MAEVAIVGIGCYAFSPNTNFVSFREGMFEAAVRAFTDCEIDPRKDVDSFIVCEEDFWEGISICNEFMPDQLGAVLKPIVTVASESLIGLASAYMQIKTGVFDIVVVESHSKASNILTYPKILELALDPLYERHLNIHPYYLASLEARYYMNKYGIDYSYFAKVVEKNKNNGLLNPRGNFASKISYEEIIKKEKLFDPLTIYDVANLTDGFIVLVLASKEVAEKLDCKPIWIKGIGWSSESSSFLFRDLPEIKSAYDASERAYKMAGITNPRRQLDFAEVDDRFSYRELMHIEALRVCKKGEAYKDLDIGSFNREGDFPVNVSGGYLACGLPLDAGGIWRVYEVALQLRGEAGNMQIKDVKNAVILSWRGINTSTYATVILSNED